MKAKILFFVSLFFILNLSFTIEHCEAQWQQCDGINGGTVHSLAISENTIFAGTNNGVYLSTNNGSIWTHTTSIYHAVFSLSISGNIILAGTNHGVFLSTNEGQNWLSTGLTGEIFKIKKIGNYLVTGSFLGGVYISANNGYNWSQSGLNNLSVLSIEFKDNIVFAGSYGYEPDLGNLYYSNNNCVTWEYSGLRNKIVQSLVANNNYIFAGTSTYPLGVGGVYISSNNGNNWLQAGLINENIYALALYENKMFAGSDSGIYLSTNNGQSWIQKNLGFTSAPSVKELFIANNYIFAGTSGNSVWRRLLSDITGDTIHTVTGTVKYSDNNQPVSGGYVKALKLNYSTMQMETIDSTGIQSNGTYILPNVRTDSVYIRPYPNSTTVVDFIPTYYPSSITWENATVLYVTSNLNNINVGVIRANIATSSSTITGSVFKTTYNPLPGLKDVLLYVKLNNEIRGFTFSNNDGYYLLNNMPAGNYKVYSNRPGYKSDSIAVNMPSGGTLNNINFTLYPFWTSIKKLESGIITEYRLEQNYPNPFNSKTKIKFEVKKSGNVKLKVFDITGKLVADIVDSELETGRYEVLFDAKNLSSSIYFYRLTTGDFTETKRMILIK